MAQAETVTEVIHKGWRRQLAQMIATKDTEGAELYKGHLQATCEHLQKYVFQSTPSFRRGGDRDMVRMCTWCGLEESHRKASDFKVLREKSISLSQPMFERLRRFDEKTFNSLELDLL